MRIVIDSNIFVSSLDRTDVFHSECYPIFERVLNSELQVLCPTLVLVETISVLRRRTREDLAVRSCRVLLDHSEVNWVDVNLDAAERASMLSAKTGLKGGDAIVLQAAEQYGVPLLTKDKEIKQKAPKDILVFDPASLPAVL